MADRPIIFSGPMVRALIEGRKTQTRRVIKKPAALDALSVFGADFLTLPGNIDLIGYAPGDRLYVREAHALLPRTAYRGSIGTGSIAQTEHPTDGYSAAVFREGFDRSGPPRWRPSIHMPRWASRLTLTVTDVRVQRLHDISEADAVAEGIVPVTRHFPPLQGVPHQLRERTIYEWSGGWSVRAADAYAVLWNSLHGPDAWDANPWVVALTFTVEQRNIDGAA
jgi:hypothetical protein